MFSVFMLDPSFGWVATHRLSFDHALDYAKSYRNLLQNSPVALVPDAVDPEPYLALVSEFA
jgi:hypothetical protein